MRRGSVVESDQALATYLVERAHVYWIGSTGGVVPEYLALDLETGWYPRDDLLSVGDKKYPGHRYGIVYLGGSYCILKLVQ